MKVLYTASATVTGGRKDGRARSSDGVLDVKLASPKEMGGDGSIGTNPEQLFAAGYAACFETALQVTARKQGLPLTSSKVTANVSIGPRETGGFGLQVALLVAVEGLPPEDARALMNTVHEAICPYSNAVRGNVEVDLQLV